MLRKNKLIVLVFVAIFLLLFLRLVYLQIIQKQKYQQLSLDNAAKTVPITAPRGIIYDRNDRVLAENRPLFSVHVLPYVLYEKAEAERQRILGKLGALLGEKITLKVSANEPIMIKENVPLEKALRIEENKRELEGVIVRATPVRHYPAGSAAAHVLGFVGEITEEDLKSLEEAGYKRGAAVGKDGVEKMRDQDLRGRDGGSKIEVDVHGVPLRILESLEPIAGWDVKLTLDMELQKIAAKALGAREGAVVILDPRNGEILAMTSSPNYDPNIFVRPLDSFSWKKLESRGHPFINRALAVYPPGSTFKPVTLAAALSDGFTRPNELFHCPGYYKVNNRIARCWKESGHGTLTPIEGLVQSCDVVFYALGRRVGPERLEKYAHLFGLGSRTEVDLPQEKKGLIPNTEWKKAFLHEPWYEGDSINYGIGQGFLQVTPLQMAVLYGGIGNGTLFRPYVVQLVKNNQNKITYQAEKKMTGKVSFSKENLKLVRQALREVVKRGTGLAASVSGIPAAGKTGTAENPGKAHAWFVCYAPDDPEISMAVFVAHGEHGDRVAAGIAREILTWYKESRLKKVYPEE